MADLTIDSKENRQISGNTVKDGSGNEWRIVVDANGELQVVQVVLDHTTDNVLIYANTQPDALGVDTVPIVDAAGHWQIDVLTMPVVTIQDGGGSITVDFTRPVPVTDNAGSLTIDDGGGNISIDDGGNVISVDDAGGSLTVDQALLDHATDDVLVYFNTQPDGLGADTVPIVDAAGHLQIDIITAPTITIQDGGNVISVDDGGGSLTIDGNVGIIGAALTALQLIDNIVNTETDDDSIPAGELRQTNNVLLYGYDYNVSASWERVRTDGSGNLMVAHA
jgi:hypothetical protein